MHLLRIAPVLRNNLWVAVDIEVRALDHLVDGNDGREACKFRGQGFGPRAVLIRNSDTFRIDLLSVERASDGAGR